MRVIISVEPWIIAIGDIVKLHITESGYVVNKKQFKCAMSIIIESVIMSSSDVSPLDGERVARIARAIYTQFYNSAVELSLLQTELMVEEIMASNAYLELCAHVTRIFKNTIGDSVIDGYRITSDNRKVILNI